MSIILRLKNIFFKKEPSPQRRTAGEQVKSRQDAQGRRWCGSKDAEETTLGKLGMNSWGQVTCHFVDPGRTPDFTKTLDQAAFQIPPFQGNVNLFLTEDPKKKKRSSLPSQPAPAHSSVISDPCPAQHSVLKKSTGRVCPGTGSSHGEPRHPQQQDEVISKNPFVLN